MRLVSSTFCGIMLSAFVANLLQADEKETKFLVPGKLIFKADFDDGRPPGKPNWQLRKSAWTVKDGELHGINIDGNGPFIRLHSQEKGGVLPENYVMAFSFKVELRSDVTPKRKSHATRTSGHRFSYGHYAAKYQWRPEIGMDLVIGHGHALQDDRFHIERNKWYHVTSEIRDDEIVVSFRDGPTYYMQHDHFRHKPSGWEFFTHIDEVGYLDNLQVWEVAGERPQWAACRGKCIAEKRAFLSADNPDFKITK